MKLRANDKIIMREQRWYRESITFRPLLDEKFFIFIRRFRNEGRTYDRISAEIQS